MIPYGKHHIDEADIQEVVDLLRNGTLTQGHKIDEFEEVFSSWVGSKYAVAVSSGTAALHLACMAKELGEGDRIITSANTFVSDANCAIFVGAQPMFCDIDAETLNMCTVDLERNFSEVNNIAAVIPVHFAGASCDMPEIQRIASNNSSYIIEDACHALGAKYPCGAKIGSCKYSDMTTFSLHPVKSIATGEGGVITTNDDSIYRKLIMLRSHGIFHQKLLKNLLFSKQMGFRNSEQAYDNEDVKPWYYEMQEIGYNYRLTEIQSVLGISQLKKLDGFIEKRRQLASVYDEAFENKNYLTITQNQYRSISAHHLYVIRINYSELGTTRAKFMRNLLAKGIGTQVHYIPVPLQPYYQNQGFCLDDYKNTSAYYDECLSIPLFFDLTQTEQEMVIESILTEIS